MKDYSQFHDGLFNGLWIEGKRVHIFLTTVQGEASVCVAEEVSALSATAFKAGNLLFEVLLREEITLQDVRTLYSFSTDEQGATLLAKARQTGAVLLELNPSYGASGLILAKSFELLRREDWLKTYVTSAPAVP